MNLLLDALPEEVEIDGDLVPINSDFRSALRVILAFEDDQLADQEKLSILLANLYPVLPENMAAAVEQGIWFLNAGEDGGDCDGPRLMSFDKDDKLIYSAFRQTHNVDLVQEDMHWWVFLALFMDLGADTAFCNLVSLRKRVKTGRATKEERRAAREMGSSFDLPDHLLYSPEEREQADRFFELLGTGEAR